jgi:hypothetical protein
MSTTEGRVYSCVVHVLSTATARGAKPPPVVRSRAHSHAPTHVRYFLHTILINVRLTRCDLVAVCFGTAQVLSDLSASCGRRPNAFVPSSAAEWMTDEPPPPPHTHTPPPPPPLPLTPTQHHYFINITTANTTSTGTTTNTTTTGRLTAANPRSQLPPIDNIMSSIAYEHYTMMQQCYVYPSCAD